MQLGSEHLDDYSILMLYLADELPAVQRAEVEKRLMVDLELREHLEVLRSAHDMLARSLDELDQAESLPASSASSGRAVSNMMAQWQVDRVRREAAEKATAQRRPWSVWTVPLAAAAALFLGFVIWWDVQLTRNPGPDPTPIAVRGADDGDPMKGLVMAGETDDDWSQQADLGDAEQQLDMVAFLRTINQ